MVAVVLDEIIFQHSVSNHLPVDPFIDLVVYPVLRVNLHGRRSEWRRASKEVGSIASFTLYWSVRF